MKLNDIIRRLDVVEGRLAKLERTKGPIIEKKKSTKKKEVIEEIEDVGHDS